MANNTKNPIHLMAIFFFKEQNANNKEPLRFYDITSGEKKITRPNANYILKYGIR